MKRQQSDALFRYRKYDWENPNETTAECQVVKPIQAYAVR